MHLRTPWQSFFYNQPYLVLLIIYQCRKVKAEVGRSWPGCWAINSPRAGHVSSPFHAGWRSSPTSSLSAHTGWMPASSKMTFFPRIQAQATSASCLYRVEPTGQLWSQENAPVPGSRVPHCAFRLPPKSRLRFSAQALCNTRWQSKERKPHEKLYTQVFLRAVPGLQPRPTHISSTWVHGLPQDSTANTVFGLKQICKGLFLSYASVRNGRTVAWVIPRLFKLSSF